MQELSVTVCTQYSQQKRVNFICAFFFCAMLLILMLNAYGLAPVDTFS